MNWPQSWYDPGCTQCNRLADFMGQVKSSHADYFCRPVPPFGDPRARLLIVGLAPGMHGANATGRPFTGDYAGTLLYRTLHKYGYASRDESVSVGDGLELTDCRITNAVKCLPPQNKPVGEEERNCNPYLRAEAAEGNVEVILALGSLAHRAVLRTLGVTLSRYRFAHNTNHELDNGIALVDSYHCSRYNTQTRRLTPQMFEQVFDTVAGLLNTGARR